MTSRLHENIAATEVNPIAVKIAAHHQKPALQRAPRGNLQLWQQLLQNCTPSFATLTQVAEGKTLPVMAKGSVALISPRGIVADAGDTDKQIDVAHDFRKYYRGNFRQA